MTETNDLRAAREHAALLKDLSALCAKYTSCPAAQPTPVPQLGVDGGPYRLNWAAMLETSGRLWQLPDDHLDITQWFGNVIPDDPSASGIIYIAGPMTGYPEWNHPAFFAMAEKLRAAGHTVICPAELHPPSHDIAWDWYLRRDLAELVKCARVVFLPGWTQSRGAILEHKVADALGLQLVYPHDVDQFIEDTIAERCQGCGEFNGYGCNTGACSR